MDNLLNQETLKQKNSGYTTVTVQPSVPASTLGTNNDIAIYSLPISQVTSGNAYPAQLYTKQTGTWSTNFNASANQKLYLSSYGQSQTVSPMSPGFAVTITGYSASSSSAIWSASYSDWYSNGSDIPSIDANGIYSPNGSAAYRWMAKGASIFGSEHMAFMAGLFKVSVLPESGTYYGIGLGGNGYGIQFLVSPDGRLIISQNEGSMYSASLASTASGLVAASANNIIYVEKYGRRFTGKVFNGNTQVGSTIEWHYAGSLGYAGLLGVQGLMLSTTSSVGRFNNVQFWG